MTIDQRDQLVLQHVARFGQLSSTHIHALVFGQHSSKTPCDRTLRRLVDRGYLARIEHRLVGGSRGGSGQYVYQLGPTGHEQFAAGRYSPKRAVNYHSLAIASTFVTLRDNLGRAGSTIVGISAEPDTHVTIARHILKPDFYLELERTTSVIAKYWFEIDMGTQGQGQIKDKLQRYWAAYNEVDPAEWPVFPIVIFVTVDDDRVRELRWLRDQGPKEARGLYRVVTQELLADVDL